LLAAANDEVQFKIKKKTKLSKVMDAYCNKQGVDRKSLRFLFDGQRIADVILYIYTYIYIYRCIIYLYIHNI